jgi:hypothetical protein
VRLPRPLRCALAACGPSLLTLGLVALFWQAGPRDFVTLWNDETIYWNEAAAFMRAGFEGGYVTVNERPAAVAASRFGPHGPGPAILYGSIGWLAGWRPYSPYLIHLLLIPLCAAAWLRARRHDSAHGSAALLLLGFWPFVFYLPTGMQEPLHFGLAMLLVALLESRLTIGLRVALCVMLFIVACLTRPTWALAIPAVMWGRAPGWGRRAASIVVCAMAFVAAFLIVTRTSAPYPYTAWVAEAVAGPWFGIPALLDAAVAGLGHFVTPHRRWVITLYRLEMVAGLIAMAVLWRRAGPGRWRIEVAALMVLPVMAALLPVGDLESGREIRVVMPHLLAALLVVSAIGPKWTLVPAVINLALLPTMLPEYYRTHDGRFVGRAEIRAFGDTVHPVMAFDPEAPSGWDNTLITHADTLQPPLVGLPHGIGISFVLDWEDLPIPPRSRYLLLREEDEPQVVPRVRLTRLAETSLGVLYRNDEPRPH